MASLRLDDFRAATAAAVSLEAFEDIRASEVPVASKVDGCGVLLDRHRHLQVVGDTSNINVFTAAHVSGSAHFEAVLADRQSQKSGLGAAFCGLVSGAEGIVAVHAHYGLAVQLGLVLAENRDLQGSALVVGLGDIFSMPLLAGAIRPPGPAAPEHLRGCQDAEELEHGGSYSSARVAKRARR